MTREFIPYEQALELKELGFDEPCLAYYDYYPSSYLTLKTYTNVGDEVGLPTPLYQQAFRWFRENHGSLLLFDYGRVPHFTIMQNLMLENQNMTYEEAELACLKKLIEIVKK